MFTETKGLNMKPLRIVHWFGDKVTEDANVFKELLNDVREADKKAAAARKVLYDVADEMPSPDVIRNNLKTARDAKLRSLYKQYEAATFYRERLFDALHEAQKVEVQRLQKICDDVFEKTRDGIIKLGEPNKLKAAQEARQKRPVLDAGADVGSVKDYRPPEFGDEDSLKLLADEIRRVAKTL